MDQNKTKEVVLQAVAAERGKDTSGPTFIDYYFMYCTVRNVYTETETFLDTQRPIWSGLMEGVVDGGLHRQEDTERQTGEPTGEIVNKVIEQHLNLFYLCNHSSSLASAAHGPLRQ